MNVLVVEDDAEGRRFLCGVVQHHWPGSTVSQAADGKEALTLFAQQRPDITLLDIELPKLNGLEVLEVMRAFRKSAFIVMVSGHSSADNVKAATAIGIEGFLVKPFEEQKVVDVFKRYLKRLGSAEHARVAVVGRGKSLSLD